MRGIGRVGLGVFVWGLASGGVALGQARGDFNGDGFDDLAIGSPEDDVAGFTNAGSVNVLYGRAGGLTTTGNQLWHQNVESVAGASEAGDFFGFSLATGDFNRDGCDDLAVGVPLEDVGVVQSAGTVNVFYGSPAGLNALEDQLWAQDEGNVRGDPGTGDQFGYALASGDFDRDGFDDLAIGIPGETVNAVLHAGAVAILFGSEAGLTDAGNQLWSQDSMDVDDVSESNDELGYALASGDFDGDGFADLAIGAPTESFDGVDFAGGVNVLYGGAGGLSGAGDQFWHEDRGTIPDEPGYFDTFGSTLVAGDFDGDGFSDLAIAAVFDTLGGTEMAGAVFVLFGRASGLTDAGNELWAKGVAGVGGTPDSSDAFGMSMAAGDLTGDGRDELVIGIPGEDNGKGAVLALKGTAGGLALVQLVTSKVDGGGQSGDFFGRSVGIGDYNGDGAADVAVGAPSDTVGGLLDVGSVVVLASRRAFPRQFWHRDVPGVLGTAETGDGFGASLGR